jgi:hypothetical protein
MLENIQGTMYPVSFRDFGMVQPLGHLSLHDSVMDTVIMLTGICVQCRLVWAFVIDTFIYIDFALYIRAKTCFSTILKVLQIGILGSHLARPM